MSVKRCYNFGPEQVQSIDSLAKELGIDKTDVLTNGLRLMRAAVKAAKRGQSIGIVNDGRVTGELVGPWTDMEPAHA